MVRTYIKRGGHGGDRKSGKETGSLHWAITLNNANYSSSCFALYIQNLEEFKAVLVGKEKYTSFVDPDTEDIIDNDNYHQHIYLELKDKVTTQYLHDVISEFSDGDGFDLQRCKSPKSWKIYCTKEDRYPYYINIDIHELSLYARANNYATTTYRTINEDRVRLYDPIFYDAGVHRNVVTASVKRRIEEVQTSYKKQRVQGIPPPNENCLYTNFIVDAFNRGLSLYIHSPPKHGKSTLVDHLLKELDLENKVLVISGQPDSFMLNNLTQKHKAVRIEDFDPKMFSYQMPTLLGLLEATKHPITINRKCETPVTMIFEKLQVIITSNFDKTSLCCGYYSGPIETVQDGVITSTSRRHNETLATQCAALFAGGIEERRLNYISIPDGHELQRCTLCKVYQQSRGLCFDGDDPPHQVPRVPGPIDWI